MTSGPGDGVTNPDEALLAMIGRLRNNGSLQTSAVEEAMRTIRRHDFIDHVTVETAYADIAVIVKTTESGTAISSASQPSIVAAMLELCQLAPGQRILEIGTGTGYNAALLSSIVGPAGQVVTIELEADLAMSAKERLRRYGFTRTEVLLGDGSNGHPVVAPYDRIIVTTGAPNIAPAWRDQLREGGRLVSPVVDLNGMGSIHCLRKQHRKLEDTSTIPCGFLPMRSS